MIIQRFIIGPIETNCYLVYDENKKLGILIDPAVFEQKILDFIKKENLKIEYILLTHGHFDHTSGADAFAKKLGAKICLHQDDLLLTRGLARSVGRIWGYKSKSFQPDIFLNDGQKFKVGDLEFEVIHTPGHSEGGVCFYFEKQKVIFSGDTLFAGSYGRTDLPGGDEEKIFESIKKLLKLPPETKVYPGHGEETKVGEERGGGY